MIKLLKCEYMKARRRYIFLTAFAITVLAGMWAFHGKLNDFMIKNGYSMLLYQLPLINSIFFPLLSTVVASRMSDTEHKGNNLKQICTLTHKGRIFDAKLVYGLMITLFMVALFWAAAIVYGRLMSFDEPLPINLYLFYLLFTVVPTAAIYIFQHSLSMIFKNQAIPFFIGILGEFAGLFSMFLPQLPMLRKSLLWGYYGALQFMGMFGWTKETRYATTYYEFMGFDWAAFACISAAAVVIYIAGRYVFCRKEI